MIIHKKPDGVIEFGLSGCCCPPGQRRPGQHTNSCTRWFRVNPPEESEEPKGQWKRYQRAVHTMELAQAAETCDEFLDAITKDP
jgi:hypothetical protein